MKINEFCQIIEKELEFGTNPKGYWVSFKQPENYEGYYEGVCWPELEGYADKLEGGTTSTNGRGATPNDALSDLCNSLKGRLLIFSKKKGEKKRKLVRAPLELTL